MSTFLGEPHEPEDVNPLVAQRARPRGGEEPGAQRLEVCSELLATLVPELGYPEASDPKSHVTDAGDKARRRYTLDCPTGASPGECRGDELTNRLEPEVASRELAIWLRDDR